MLSFPSELIADLKATTNTISLFCYLFYIPQPFIYSSHSISVSLCSSTNVMTELLIPEIYKTFITTTFSSDECSILPFAINIWQVGVKQQEGTFGGHRKVLYLECGHDYKIEILKNASHYIFKRCILLYINDISIKFFKLRNRVTNEALMDYMDAKLCKLYTKNLKCLLKWFRRPSLLKMALLQRT